MPYAHKALTEKHNCHCMAHCHCAGGIHMDWDLKRSSYLLLITYGRDTEVSLWYWFLQLGSCPQRFCSFLGKDGLKALSVQLSIHSQRNSQVIFATAQNNSKCLQKVGCHFEQVQGEKNGNNNEVVWALSVYCSLTDTQSAHSVLEQHRGAQFMMGVTVLCWETVL